MTPTLRQQLETALDFISRSALGHDTGHCVHFANKAEAELRSIIDVVDALLAENAAKNDILNWNLETGMSASARAFHVGCDAKGCLHDAVQAMLIHFHTPATSAALAAIEARGVEKFVTKVAERLRTAGGEDGYSLVHWGEYADHLEAKGEEFAIELLEAK